MPISLCPMEVWYVVVLAWKCAISPECFCPCLCFKNTFGMTENTEGRLRKFLRICFHCRIGCDPTNCHLFGVSAFLGLLVPVIQTVQKEITEICLIRSITFRNSCSIWIGALQKDCTFDILKLSCCLLLSFRFGYLSLEWLAGHLLHILRLKQHSLSFQRNHDLHDPRRSLRNITSKKESWLAWH